MPGQLVAMDKRCPVCSGDGWPHLLQLHVSTHFLCGNCLLVRTGAIDAAVANSRVGSAQLESSSICSPIWMFASKGLGPYVERRFLQRGMADTRGKMRPDMMRLEMTTAEQQQFLRHDGNSGSRLTALTPVMPDENPRSVKIMEGEYCHDTRYAEELQEKKAQHEALELLRTTDTCVAAMPIILGQSGSRYHTAS